MKGLRRLSNGEWNKPPVLTAARQVFALGLASRFPKCALGKAASFLNGTSYDVDRVSPLAPSPIIRISNLTDPASAYLRTDEDLGSKYWVRPGDLLVSWSASFKSALWTGPEGYLNQHIFKVTEHSGFDRRYMRHIIEASLDAMQERVVGIGMMHLRRSDFLGHLIPAPPLSVQAAVAKYLDWLESDRIGIEPPLPAVVIDQHRIVTRIDELAREIEEACSLRKLAAAEAEAFVVSVHTQLAGARTRQLGQVLRLHEDATPISPTSSYPQVGIRSFGGGLFAKGSIAGTQTTYRTFNRLYEGALVLSQVKGWEGAVAACPAALVGWFASPEYRTFRCIPSEARSGYFGALIRTEWFWRRLKDATRGVGARRERTRPEQFLRIEIPMPEVELQERGEALFAYIDKVARLQTETVTEIDALLPAILDRAFKGAVV